jgi:Domain of unknown function (DUF4276)
MKLGVIAEDDSDVAVIREITLSLLRPHRFRFKQFVGHGCGKLRRKCAAWARNLVLQGCSWIVVVHDLDVHDENELRNTLTLAVALSGAKETIVLIPKHEIEAWLLYDGRAIAAAFGQSQTPKLPGDPEALSDPKRYLGDLVWRKYRKDYLNTIHNARIAKLLDIRKLKRSASFAPHPEFTAAVKKALR